MKTIAELKKLLYPSEIYGTTKVCAGILDILSDHEQKIAKLEVGLKQDASPIPPDTATAIYCRK